MQNPKTEGRTTICKEEDIDHLKEAKRISNSAEKRIKFAYHCLSHSVSFEWYSESQPSSNDMNSKKSSSSDRGCKIKLYVTK